MNYLKIVLNVLNTVFFSLILMLNEFQLLSITTASNDNEINQLSLLLNIKVQTYL